MFNTFIMHTLGLSAYFSVYRSEWVYESTISLCRKLFGLLAVLTLRVSQYTSVRGWRVDCDFPRTAWWPRLRGRLRRIWMR